MMFQGITSGWKHFWYISILALSAVRTFCPYNLQTNSSAFRALSLSISSLRNLDIEANKF